MEGRPLARVLVDKGSVLNVVLVNVMHMLGKSPEDVIPTDVSISGFTGGIVKMQGILPLELTVGDRTFITTFFVIESTAANNLLLGRKWIHPNFCILSSLHQMLIFWDGDEVKVVEADNRPFVARVYHADAELYSEEFIPIRFIGKDSKGRPRKATMRRTLTEEDVRELSKEHQGQQFYSRPVFSTTFQTKLFIKKKPKENRILGQVVNCCLARLKAYLAELRLERTADASTSFSTNVLKILERTEDKLDAIQLTDLKAEPMKLDDLKVEVRDPLLEVNLGTKQDPRPNYISKLLEPTFREELISLLE